jgi:hypothetical protein
VDARSRSRSEIGGCYGAVSEAREMLSNQDRRILLVIDGDVCRWLNRTKRERCFSPKNLQFYKITRILIWVGFVRQKEWWPKISGIEGLVGGRGGLVVSIPYNYIVDSYMGVRLAA